MDLYPRNENKASSMGLLFLILYKLLGIYFSSMVLGSPLWNQAGIN